MSDSGAHPARRRNGRLVACNPCRLRKVACDHSRPACTRCLKRRQSSRCIYPEPDAVPVSALPSEGPTPADSGASFVSPPEDGQRHQAHPAQLRLHTHSTHPSLTGFIGFAAQSIVFEDAQNSLSQLGVPMAENAEMDLEAGHQPQTIAFGDLPKPLQESCLFVLRCLPGQCNEQIKFVSNREVGGGWGHVAVDLIAQSLQQTFHPLLSRGDAGLESMAAILCNNTMRPFQDIHEDPRGWLGQFCGANLRWESLGLLWAQLTRVSDILDALNSRSVDWVSEEPSMGLAQACLGFCIEICRFLSRGNDLLLDICRRKTTLDSIVDGDGTLPTFSSHAIAMSMITYLGLHALDNDPTYVPSLCSENRRRLFCQVFSSDKLGMVFTGRPPLLGRRYCSTPPPLDLRDEDLMSDPATLLKAVQSLDDKGWNTEGGIYSATVIRARYIIARVRDEIFEIALDKSATLDLDQLLTIKARQHATLSEFPPVLIYQPGDSTSPEVSTRTLYVRLILKLEHLQNLFFVDKLLLRYGYMDDGDLLVWSYELVVLTLKFWTNKDRFGSAYIRRNFEWLSMTYAAPGGGVLCQELLQPTFSGVHHKNPQLSRSNMVQQLSLLIGFLDWVPKTAPNWELCVACKKVIQRVLDHHLNGTFENGRMTTVDPVHWGFLDQPDFSFELLDTFDWLRPEG